MAPPSGLPRSVARFFDDEAAKIEDYIEDEAKLWAGDIYDRGADRYWEYAVDKAKEFGEKRNSVMRRMIDRYVA